MAGVPYQIYQEITKRYTEFILCPQHTSIIEELPNSM